MGKPTSLLKPWYYPQRETLSHSHGHFCCWYHCHHHQSGPGPTWPLPQGLVTQGLPQVYMCLPGQLLWALPTSTAGPQQCPTAQLSTLFMCLLFVPSDFTYKHKFKNKIKTIKKVRIEHQSKCGPLSSQGLVELHRLHAQTPGPGLYGFGKNVFI